MQKITPCLWFDGKAEEAARFYTSIFRGSRIERVTHYGDLGEGGPGAPGTVMTVTFVLEGQEFTALDGGPLFSFTPAISLAVSCETQAEVDELWAKLSADGGEPGHCGWLTDKFGVSWQIVPAVLYRMVDDADPARSARVMKALLGMTKLDLDALKRAGGER